MKLEIFDVVELIDHNKAIILEVNAKTYKVNVLKENESINESRIISDKDIINLIYKKQ